MEKIRRMKENTKGKNHKNEEKKKKQRKKIINAKEKK